MSEFSIRKLTYRDVCQQYYAVTQDGSDVAYTDSLENAERLARALKLEEVETVERARRVTFTYGWVSSLFARARRGRIRVRRVERLVPLDLVSAEGRAAGREEETAIALSGRDDA